MYYWLLVPLCVGPVSTIPVFDFRSSEDIIYLKLSNEPEVFLPSSFVLCTSHKQKSMDQKGFYQIYGADNAPWMSSKLSIGSESDVNNSVGLWGYFGSSWVYIGDIKSPKLYYWYHMCSLIDTVRGFFSVSVNGERMATDILVESLLQNRPKLLSNNLVIGKMTQTSRAKESVDEQFLGYVSNVQVFSASNRSIDSLSANACSEEGDILAWNSSIWLQTGDGLSRKETDHAGLCSREETYDLALPLGLDQTQAIDTCNKLGGGRMTVVHNQKELTRFANWFQGTVPGACSRIWTPYSDQFQEGRYVSLEDGSLPTFLPWAVDQPNGGRTENGIDIRMDPRNGSLHVFYYDEDTKAGVERFICSSCSLARHFSLQLKGVCEHTLMGRNCIHEVSIC